MRYSLDEILEKFNILHPDYKYDITYYINNKQRINVICNIGHNFETSIDYHLKGAKCPYCSGFKKSNEYILNELNIIHSNKYKYHNLDFNSIKKADKIQIICNEHGVFKQSYKHHYNGSGCPKCANVFKKDSKLFIEELKKMDNTLNYGQVEYINNKTNINIICPKHGAFMITPNQIINQVREGRQICVECYSYNKRFDAFLEKANNKYNNKYLYYDFVDNKKKMRIVDKETGFEYNQVPNNHINCDYFYNKSDIDKFIKKSKEVHGDKYDYSKVEYINHKCKIKLICDKFHEFEQIVDNHLRGAGCPKCNRFDIKENSLYEFIKENYDGQIITSNRNILDGKELDIYLPELNLAFEFNGLYWHNELFKDKKYHLDKTNNCLKKNIKLIHIWEDDWDNKKSIIKSIILNKLGKCQRIFARKCEIKTPNNKDVREFLNNNHIQGFVGSKIKIGLYFENELVSLMTFGSLRKSLGQKSIDDNYEMLRFCNKLNTTVVGGASKLFKHFTNNYNFTKIISYSDNSRGIGNLYTKLGFEFSHNSLPNYYYIINSVRKHRFNYRKDNLVKEGFDENKTEVQIMNERGFYRIFDSGCKKWTFNI